MHRRMWHGPAIWMAATVVDLALVLTVPWWQAGNGGPAGLVSVAGFALGVLWAQTGPRWSATTNRTEDTDGKQ